ncbi:MAG: hypothetical protein PHT19_16060 [Methylococcus sp.]|nr:hypothetical protein [Methylococcus sp.]
MEYTFTAETRPPLSCGKAKYLVILIHGIGSSANEIIDLSMDWAPTLNKAEFFAPEIPWQDQGNSLPGGANGSAIRNEFLADLTGHLHDYLDSIIEEKHLTNLQVALVGFGEGASLAISTGIGRETPLGAVVAVGRGLKEFPEPRGQGGNQTPVLLALGAIGIETTNGGWGDTKRWLQGLGMEVDELQAPGDYFGLDDQGVIKVAEYLRARLVKTDLDSCD